MEIGSVCGKRSRTEVELIIHVIEIQRLSFSLNVYNKAPATCDVGKKMLYRHYTIGDTKVKGLL